MQRGTLSRTAGGERAGHQHTSEGQCRPSRCVSVPLSCWWPVSYSNHLITVTGLKLLTLKKPAAVWVTAPLSAQQSALRCSHWLCATQIRSICTFYMYHQHFHNVEHNNHITCTANEPTPGVFTWATRPRCSLPVSNSYCIKIWENFFVATKLQILNEMFELFPDVFVAT